MTYVEDETIYPFMLDLVSCVVTELEERQLPGLCRAGLVPGQSAVLDACSGCATGKCQGQMWVRLVNEFPSSVFPAPDQSGATCDAPMAYTVEVGIARCLPVGATSGINGYIPPSMEEQLEATRLQLADKAAMKKAITCCADKVERSLVVNGYQAIQATGDCGGGVWTLTIWDQ
jgi:hypothetical protein